MKKFTQGKQIHAQRPQQNKVGNKFKVNNKNTRMTSLTPFRCLYFMMSLHISHVIVESVVNFEQENVCQGPMLRISIYPRAERGHSSTVFIFNFQHISYIVLVLLLLILSTYLIAGFDIIYSFLERVSTKWNAHPIASSSKQDIFIINFNAKSNANFFISFVL